jgi:hypothetical protein
VLQLWCRTSETIKINIKCTPVIGKSIPKQFTQNTAEFSVSHVSLAISQLADLAPEKVEKE